MTADAMSMLCTLVRLNATFPQCILADTFHQKLHADVQSHAAMATQRCRSNAQLAKMM